MPFTVGLPGTVHGRITILAEAPRLGGRGRRVHCVCTCGTEFDVLLNNIRRGITKSCGCLFRERGVLFGVTHGFGGKNRPLEYRSWMQMRQRCLNPNDDHYKWYGGRGITICPEWDDFIMFRHDMGPRPSKEYTLDRLNTNGNYEPSNCRWATYVEQARGRRNTPHHTFDGRTMSMAAWAEQVGIPSNVLRQRLRKQGWTLEQALTTPIQFHRPRSKK